MTQPLDPESKIPAEEPASSPVAEPVDAPTVDAPAGAPTFEQSTPPVFGEQVPQQPAYGAPQAQPQFGTTPPPPPPYGAPQGGPAYGAAPQGGQFFQGDQYNTAVGAPKSKIVAGILGILLGAFGIHNFYLGQMKKAIAQLLITVLSVGMLSWVSAIWGLIEGILILISKPGDPWHRDARGIELSD